MTMVPVERQAEILKAVGLDPRQPLTQALVMVANRYGLDPILKHVYIIRDSIYVSHAALLHIAHKSGDFDGMDVKCEELEDRWVATARIYRRSYTHPFEYEDVCYKNEQKVPDKRKRAITRAERNALRRAFDVEVDVEPEHIERTPPLSPAAPPLPGEIEQAAVDYRPAMILCREMQLPEDLRHMIVLMCTTGRSNSVKDMGRDEFGDLLVILRALKTGHNPVMNPAVKEEINLWLTQRESPTKTPE